MMAVVALPLAPHVPPEQMTGRARAYLTIASTRHLAVAFAAVFMSSARFSSPVFAVIKSILPMWAWGIVFAGAGIACGMAAILGRETLARAGLIASASSTALWAGGFAWAVINGPPNAGVVGVIFIIALVAKDLVVCRQPLRSPFESLARFFDNEDGPVRVPQG